MKDDVLKNRFYTYIMKVISSAKSDFVKKYININEVVSLEENEKVFSLSVNDTAFFYEEKDYRHLENIFTLDIFYNSAKDLSTRQKEILYLSIIEGLSGKEIAEILGCNENNVWTSKSKAIKSFIENVKKENNDEKNK